MRIIWKNIDNTFKAASRQQSKITESEMRRSLAAMLVMLNNATPEDTGYAKSRWVVMGEFPRFRVENDTSYIEHLNNGSSKQAPKFFIESIALRFGVPNGTIVTVVPSNPGS